jgi:hypothetical protein
MRCCKDCAHAIFDEVFGEWKCKVVQHRIYEEGRLVACKDYIHKKKVFTEKADVEET